MGRDGGGGEGEMCTHVNWITITESKLLVDLVIHWLVLLCKYKFALLSKTKHELLLFNALSTHAVEPLMNDIMVFILTKRKI